MGTGIGEPPARRWFPWCTADRATGCDPNAGGNAGLPAAGPEPGRRLTEGFCAATAQSPALHRGGDRYQIHGSNRVWLLCQKFVLCQNCKRLKSSNLADALNVHQQDNRCHRGRSLRKLPGLVRRQQLANDPLGAVAFAFHGPSPGQAWPNREALLRTRSVFRVHFRGLRVVLVRQGKHWE